MTATPKDRIIVVPDSRGLALEGARLFECIAMESVERSGRFTVALSGGNTPRPMNRLLGAEPFRSSVPWAHTRIFWVDERLVPPEDPASNFGAAQADFLESLPIPRGHIHPMCSEKPPPQAADDYQRELMNQFNSAASGPPAFDLVVLGIGADGHTASIFPGDGTAVETDRWVAAVKGGSPNVARLTLTQAVLNQARHVLFLVSGRQKAAIVRTILTDAACCLPARQIAAAGGPVVWMLDQEAAHLLPTAGTGSSP